MTAGNGSVRIALDGDSDTARLLWNALFVEHGAPQFMMSKAEWAQRWQPHPNLLEAIRRFARRKDDDDE
jgi:hypothetical protein